MLIPTPKAPSANAGGQQPAAPLVNLLVNFPHSWSPDVVWRLLGQQLTQLCRASQGGVCRVNGPQTGRIGVGPAGEGPEVLRGGFARCRFVRQGAPPRLCHRGRILTVVAKVNVRRVGAGPIHHRCRRVIARQTWGLIVFTSDC